MLGASLLLGAAACLHLASCSQQDGDAGAADAAAAPEATVAEADVADARAVDADADAADSAVTHDADAGCGPCASGVCSDGGCDPAVFVTSKKYTGAISGDGGLAAADDECMKLAAAAGVRGTFRAWLSAAGGASPATRFVTKSTRPYRRLDGKRVAADWNALTKTLESTISVTEELFDMPFAYAWTATSPDGLSVPDGGDCTGWTSADPGVKGGSGETDDVIYEWTAFGEIGCATPARIYCFEQ